MAQTHPSQHPPTHPAKQPVPPGTAQNAQLPPLSIVKLNAQQRGICEARVSSELEAACGYAVKANLRISDAAVQAWLRRHAPLIIATEAKWKVDRRAIAGVVAWEALQNVRNTGTWFRQLFWGGIGYGPGKVHASDSSAVDVEEAGYLPRSADEAGRRERLANVRMGITYIAAIMRGFADLFTCLGKYTPAQTYWNPGLLAFAYHGFRFARVREHYGDSSGKLNATNHPTLDISQDNPALAPWVVKNLSFLEAAVGRTPPALIKAGIDKLPNFQCQYSGKTAACAQKGCPHLANP